MPFFKKLSKKNEGLKILTQARSSNFKETNPTSRKELIDKMTDILFTKLDILDKIIKIENQVKFIGDTRKYSSLIIELQSLKQQERNLSKMYIDIYNNLSYNRV